MGKYGITEPEIKSLLAYQGAAQPTEGAIYNYFRTYEIINMLLFPGIENERIRLSEEERNIDEGKLDYIEEILSIRICIQLFASIRTTEQKIQR